MARSKILGKMGSDNYRVSDCPFHLPKENLKFFQTMQDAASKDPYSDYKSYGNAYTEDWKKLLKENINKAIKESIDEYFSNSLNEYGDFLGKGNNGEVIDNGDGTVTKTYFSGKVKATDLPFYEYCLRHNCEIFPKVYEIGKDYVVMEKVNCNTPKCNKWIEALDEDFHGRTIWEWACAGGMPKTMNRTPELRFRADVLCWCLQLNHELEKINDPRISLRQCDLQEKNIGEREDGSIVIFDI